MVIGSPAQGYAKLALRGCPGSIGKNISVKEFIEVLDDKKTISRKLYNFNWHQSALVKEYVMKSILSPVYVKRLSYKDGTTAPLNL